ncbi:hypothetical protein [Micromonospora maritima]|uniref:Uncharacterized protein n=1 Tax=Micromonospora maritima TaxID=986711 RepID=A0ABW7ZR89_9ACTN
MATYDVGYVFRGVTDAKQEDVVLDRALAVSTAKVLPMHLADA